MVGSEVPHMKSQNFEFLQSASERCSADLAGFAERFAHEVMRDSLIKQRSSSAAAVIVISTSAIGSAQFPTT
jgi:type I restriction enzyme R subunit